MQKKIVLVGGPGTGKSSVLNELSKRGFMCMEEISREVTLNAKKEGIDQLFLEKPILFSELLLEGRLQQYTNANNIDESIIFFDRGIPDVEAYLKFSNTEIPKIFSENSQKHKYNQIFYFHPWSEIYKPDNERYETFEQSTEINQYLINTYKSYGYQLIDVPFGTIPERVDFILNSIS